MAGASQRRRKVNLYAQAHGAAARLRPSGNDLSRKTQEQDARIYGPLRACQLMPPPCFTLDIMNHYVDTPKAPGPVYAGFWGIGQVKLSTK
jgi:hypothetical protein